MKFNYHFITAILKLQNSASKQYFIDQVGGLLKSGNKKAFSYLILYLKQKWHDIKQKQRRNFKQKSGDLEHEWRALEQMLFKTKSWVICNKSQITMLRSANQIAGIASDSKMDRINGSTPVS